LRHQSLLAYANYRFFKVAVAVMALTIAAYLYDNPPRTQRRHVARLHPRDDRRAAHPVAPVVRHSQAALRHRSVTPSRGSAHVYLGATLIVIATLHAAFQVD
jgi:hypothetical protein